MNNTHLSQSLRILITTCVAACLPCAVFAADTSLKPYLSVAMEATDNVYEQPLNKRHEFITRVRPGVAGHYQSPLWTWDLTYAFEYRNYARASKSNEYNHDASLKGTIAAVENLLYLDLSDTYKRVSLDVARNAATESSLFLNQTDQNVASVSPYIRWRLRGDNILKTGYRFTDTRYWDTTSIDKREHQGFMELTHELTAKFSISAGYTFNRLESKPSRYNKHDAFGGFRYEYADKSFLFGQVGNSWQKFDHGANVNYLFWNAGLTHDLGVAVATLETKVATTEDPQAVSTRETSYSGKLEKTMQRGIAGLSASYSEFANTATDQIDRNRLSLSAYGRYELLQDLTASLTTTGERFSQKSSSDFPYRFTGVAGLSYAFKDELTLSLTYTHVSNLKEADFSSQANRINKAVIEIRKTF